MIFNLKAEFILSNMKSNLEFQIISWHSCDETLDVTRTVSDGSKKSYNQKEKSRFVISLFGKDHDDKTYTVKVENFTPYFYIKVSDDFTKYQRQLLEDWLRDEMQFKYKECFLKTSVVKRHSFRNFDKQKKYKFVRFVFNNKGAMRNAVSKFQKRERIYKDKTILKPAYIKILGLTKKPVQYELYDNMVDPLLKFIHHRDIDTVGWVHIKSSKYSNIDIATTCDTTVRCDWKSVKKIEGKGNTNIKIMAFDIECDSSHGDFPLPIKDYTKLSREIYYAFLKLMKNDPDNLLENKTKFVNKCILASFKKGDSDIGISKIYNKAFGKISKYSRNVIASSVAEYLIVENTRNSIEIKNHNIKCIEEINRVLNNTRTYKKLLECLIEHEVLEDDDVELDRYKWEYRRITDKFPPNADEFVSQRDIDKLINYYNEVENDDGELKYPELEDDLENKLPRVKGDKTIQIGLSFVNYGSRIPYKNYMLTLKGCETLDNAITESFKTEKHLLMRFTEIIQSENPDVITGWNTDGFDIPWLFKRASETGCSEEFSKMSKLKDFESKLKIKQKKSYTGELVNVDYVDIVGRIQMDLLPLVRKSYNLGSYKLDNVAAHFINGEIIKLVYDESNNKTTVFTKSVVGLNNENFVIFNILDGYLDNQYMEGKKFEITNLNKLTKTFNVQGKIELDLEKSCKWCLGKDDVTPKDIFRLQKGDDHDRFIIAKYCMMDVILCIELLNKLELLTNNIGMANVCKNPLSWIIHRGQGVKILSLVSYFLKSKDYILPFLYKDSFDREGYEGAVVLDPNPGIYIDRPIAVLDYSSLYPSSMIEVNLSHETIVTNPIYLGEDGGQHLNEQGYDFEDITYDRYKTLFTPGGAVKGKEKVGEKTVRYVQYRDGSKGLIPQILDYLLSARKNTRKKIKYKTIHTRDGELEGLYDSDKNIIKVDGEEVTVLKESIIDIKDTYNEFEKKVLDGLQQAFKVTANSLYGQLGAKTSDIYYKEIAASTTAVGRERLIIAKDFAVDTTNYPQKMDNGETIYLKNKITYGDTDSIFVEFQCLDGKGGKLIGRDARKRSIELAIYTEKKIQKNILRAPQNLEYEKTFDPFILLSKKRYVGNLYEHDPDKYKRKSMGIVLKRRDNAPIVKVIYGGIIDRIMKEKDIRPAIVFLKKSLRKLIKDHYPMKTLIVTKTLSSFYKDPDRIAHKVLADRIGERDPGNKPQINDRIPYVYIYKNSHEFADIKYIKLIEKLSVLILTKKSSGKDIITLSNKKLTDEEIYDCPDTFKLVWNWPTTNKGYIEDKGDNKTLLKELIKKGYVKSTNKSWGELPRIIDNAEINFEYIYGRNVMDRSTIPVRDHIFKSKINRVKKKMLQGDRIENPKFIKEHNLKPDYEHYITNQIMKPVSQIFALCLAELPGFTKDIKEFNNKYNVYLEKGKSKNDSIKYMLECKRKEAAKILFRDILRILENKRENNTLITDYFAQ